MPSHRNRRRLSTFKISQRRRDIRSDPRKHQLRPDNIPALFHLSHIGIDFGDLRRQPRRKHHQHQHSGKYEMSHFDDLWLRRKNLRSNSSGPPKPPTPRPSPSSTLHCRWYSDVPFVHDSCVLMHLLRFRCHRRRQRGEVPQWMGVRQERVQEDGAWSGDHSLRKRGYDVVHAHC